VKRISDLPFSIKYNWLKCFCRKDKQFFMVFPRAFQHTYPQFSLIDAAI